MSAMGEHFDALLTRIENAIKSLLEHDIPEVKAAAIEAAEAVAVLRSGAPAAPTGVFTPVSDAAMDAARIHAPSTVPQPVTTVQA